MRYEGYTGTIVVDGTDLIWLRRGLVAKVNRLPAQRRVPLTDITGAVLTPATRLINGQLTVLLRGEEPPALTSGTAAAHPGTVLFRYRDRELFGQLHQWLLRVADINAGPQATATDHAGTGEAGETGGAMETGEDPPVLARDEVLHPDQAVELAWSGPPGWATSEPGWWPDAAWAAALEPGDDAPADHQFWRVVAPPEAVTAAAGDPPDLPAEHREQGSPSAAERRRWEVSTFRGRLVMLNDLERLLVRAGGWRSEWASEDTRFSSLGVRLPIDHPATTARLEAWESFATMITSARDWLLHALTSGSPASTEYFAWIDQFSSRSDVYWAAERAVDEELDEQRDRVLATMTAEQRHRYWHGDGPAPGSREEWQAAEGLAERLLHQLGFEDAARTPAGADKGLDVASDVVAAQVKYTSTPVGRPVLQQLQGAAGGRITVFFSRAGYSSTAIAYAAEVGMALFQLTLPVRVSAVNEAARRMVSAEDQP